MLIALDFESEAIEPRPKYPPIPVGLAIMEDGDEGVYHAWGHPFGNNNEKDSVGMLLEDILSAEEDEFVFHNAPFDCDIIETHFKIKIPWNRVHDTMLMAFMMDPYGELSLKPLAERHLGEPPTEQEAVRQWLVAHGICHANAKDWGAHIAKAPGDLVGTYAIGDVRRTLGLYKFFKPKLAHRRMI
jgi:DNA polymerase I-like protein with 3'-5' exonuclease and polymerase domains